VTSQRLSGLIASETQPVPEFKLLKRNTFRPTVLLSFDASSVYKTIALLLRAG
jgi:hypothetical protein